MLDLKSIFAKVCFVRVSNSDLLDFIDASDPGFDFTRRISCDSYMDFLTIEDEI